jgi:hypothetical protein
MSNTVRRLILVGLAAVLVALPELTQAQLALIPTSAAEVPGTPTSTHYVQTLGLMACVWDWLLVNFANRRADSFKVSEPSKARP